MPTYGRGTGFINPGQYLAANAGQGSRMAGDLTDDFERRILGYQGDLNSLQGEYSQQVGNDNPRYHALSDMAGYSPLVGRAAGLDARAQLYRQPGATGALLQEHYGAATPGGNAIDSFLTNAEGGQQLRDAGANGGDLYRMLGLSGDENTYSAAQNKSHSAPRNGAGAKIGGPPSPQPPAPFDDTPEYDSATLEANDNRRLPLATKARIYRNDRRAVERAF